MGDPDTLTVFDQYDQYGNLSKSTSGHISPQYVSGYVDEAKSIDHLFNEDRLS